MAGSLLLAIISAALVIGGISLALAESYVPEIPSPTQTQDLNAVITQAFNILTDTQSLPSETVAPPVTCLPPEGWIQHPVQPGEDLASIALDYQSTPEEILEKNCLFSSKLTAGSILYVPPILAKTAAACGQPTGWIQYLVQSGNNMYSISYAYSISIPELQFANCIASHLYSISVGQSLWVPNVTITRSPPITATHTLTPVSIIFPTLTKTATITLTATSSFTSTPTPSITATDLPPTTTPTASATITAYPSSTTNP